MGLRVEQKLGKSLDRGDYTVWINASLKPITCLGGKPELLTGFANHGVDEVRRLEQKVGGGIGDFGLKSAHDAGNSDWSFAVADHHLSVQFVFDSVERRELFAWLGISDDDLVAVQFVSVERVKRLTEFEHHVVGKVDQEADGADARSFEPRLDPSGGRVFCVDT